MPTVLVKAESPSEKDQKFEVNEGAILYDELERQGLVLPHGCLSGSCGACRIEILEGELNLSNLGVIESDTIAHLKQDSSDLNKIVIRLSCRAKVLGDIKISKI